MIIVQEICFITDNHYGEFLKEYIPEGTKSGPIINTKGKIIGRHRGIIYYTIGQRRWIGIADKYPLYVVSINKKENTIVVGNKGDVYRNELVVSDLNFLYMESLRKPLKVEAKVRYRHPPAQATVIPQDNGKVRVKFKQPQWAITPGQAAVFYNGDTVVGGGTICSSAVEAWPQPE